MGISTQNAQFYCKAMSGCGYAGKCGDAHRQTPDCPFTPLFGAGQVPGDASTAFGAFASACPAGFTAPCPSLDEYNKAVTFMDKAYLHEGEEDWIKADSVLFNAFIFLQLFNEVGAVDGVKPFMPRWPWGFWDLEWERAGGQSPLHQPVAMRGLSKCC